MQEVVSKSKKSLKLTVMKESAMDCQKLFKLEDLPDAWDIFEVILSFEDGQYLGIALRNHAEITNAICVKDLDQNILVKKYKGYARLSVDDIILSANEKSFEDITLDDAEEVLRNLRGSVKFLVKSKVKSPMAQIQMLLKPDFAKYFNKCIETRCKRYPNAMMNKNLFQKLAGEEWRGELHKLSYLIKNPQNEEEVYQRKKKVDL